MDIEKLISGGESEMLELKKSTAELKEAVISIVAILNKHQKGILYFGVKNDGKIIGQDISEKTLRDISKAISDGIEPKIYPEVNKIFIGGNSCVEVKFHGSNVPYFASGRAYIGVSDEDRQLSAKEIETLILKKNKDKMNWESELSEYSIGKVDESAVKDYVKRANIAGRIDFAFDNTKSILKKLNLIKDGRLLKAAEVLFCNENSLEVQAAVFAGTDRVTFLDIKQFRGTIFSLLEKSEEYIKERINWRAEIGRLEREEIPEIPIKAIREALVNSFCHRDYFAPESNKIAIFRNRVEIWNPGTFPEGLTPDDFIKGEEQSVLRNPLIAEIIYKSKEIEKWGSGLKRIYEECSANHVNVEFRRLKTGFSVVFYRAEGFTPKGGEDLLKKGPVERWDDLGRFGTIASQLNERQISALRHVIKEKRITREEYVNLYGVTKSTAHRDLRELVDKGVLSAKSKGRATYYVLAAG